jgi:hypothetical protein
MEKANFEQKTYIGKYFQVSIKPKLRSISVVVPEEMVKCSFIVVYIKTKLNK